MNELEFLTPEEKKERQEKLWAAEGEHWLKEGRAIAAELQTRKDRLERMMWDAGDWLTRGKERYGDRYKIAADLFGRALGTLRNAASVCGRIEGSRRHDNLSFDHHFTVAPLKDAKEQDRFLALAERNDWSVKELREQIREAGADREVAIALPKMQGSFVPAKWALQFTRWAQLQDIPSMSPEQKRSLRRELEPIRAFYDALAEVTPTPGRKSIPALAQGR